MEFYCKTASCSNPRRFCHSISMDFKKDVENMVKSLKEAGISVAKPYHGSLSNDIKSQTDKSFRAQEVQFLVATEAYEVGTYSPHVNLVFRSGCMRQAVPENSSNISFLLKNIYLEDRLHAVKIVAMEKNINIEYGSRGQNASSNKGKRSSLAKACESSPEKYLTPPDKRRRFFSNEKEHKRRTGRALIGSLREVE